MLYYLLGILAAQLEREDQILTSLFRSIMFRTAASSLTAFLGCVLVAPYAINWLRRRYRERINCDSDRLEQILQSKQDTPTMGGLFVLAALIGSTLLWANLGNVYILLGLALTAGLGTLGAIDDLTKLQGSRRGLSEREKLAGQVVLGLLTGICLYWAGRDTPYGSRLVLPAWNGGWSIGLWIVPWIALVVCASSNGVNLTDGLDGLAGGCLIFAAAAVGLCDYIGGHARIAEHLSVPYVPGSGELTVLVGAAIGATLGFLWFNCHPAEVFLGDTGSLALGGLLGYAALVPRQELLLVLAGGVFVAEAISVLVQRYYFKVTGRRILLCAPLHHHYQFLGWPESKIVVRFWITAALLAILAVATLKLR